MPSGGWDFGSALRSARKAKGMSQPELAKKMKVRHVSISRWENGHACHDILTLRKICEAIHVSADSLLGIGKDAGSIEKARRYDLIARIVGKEKP